MRQFRNDYSEICAPEIWESVQRGLAEQNVGYGLDAHSAHAEELIKKEFGLGEDSAVFFLAGGTQTNAVVLSYLLRPYESVICCDTGHINVHETGAVEGTGHKILTAKNDDGKLRASDVEKIVQKCTDEHVVLPKAVYISDATESGTTYEKAELIALRKVCEQYGLTLFLDGARLGSALTVEGSDVSAKDIGALCDVFYVGGTKNGAFLGEAVVFKDKKQSEHFRYHIKNRGAMLAKGFVLGIEFETLFENGLYYSLAKHANDCAKILRDGLKEIGVSLCSSSKTNQTFFQVATPLFEKLSKRYGLELWEKNGDGTVVARAVCSFQTEKEDCAELLAFLKENL